MPSFTRRLLAIAATAVVAALSLTGCGGGEERVALAIDEVEWVDATQLVVRTECAEIDEATFLPATGDAPATMTIWGAPKLGTCQPQVVVPVAAGTTKVVDAATSQVVDLPPRP
jgi:hypothetical protein